MKCFDFIRGSRRRLLTDSVGCFLFCQTMAVITALLFSNGAVRANEAESAETSQTDKATASATMPADWPQFRGPAGDGHAGGSGLPLKWGKRKNIVWKVPVAGRGWSSPVIKNGKLWLTTATKKGRSLRVLCFDCRSGKELWNVEAFQKKNPGRINPKNSHASPTVVLEGDRGYAHFGAHGTACLTSDGTVIWRRQIDYYHHHGPAGSPIIVDDLMVFSCDGFHRPFYDKLVRPDVKQNQFVIALDKQTGKTHWRKERSGRHSYSTPLAIQADAGMQIISPGGDRVVAYDSKTGDAVWSCRYNGYSVVPRPVFGHGLIFVCTGFDAPRLLAIRAGGRGDVTNSHVKWTLRQGVPQSASPLLVGDELYLFSDGGVVSCLDAKTGKGHWRRRLARAFSASPLFAEGRIYISAENGVTHVFAPGTRYRKRATNKLKGHTFASMAVAGKALFIRTERALYRIEKAAEKQADK